MEDELLPGEQAFANAQELLRAMGEELPNGTPHAPRFESRLDTFDNNNDNDQDYDQPPVTSLDDQFDSFDQHKSQQTEPEWTSHLAATHELGLVAVQETDDTVNESRSDSVSMNGQRALDREFGNLFSMRSPTPPGEDEEEIDDVKVTNQYSRLCHGFVTQARLALQTEARTRALSSTPAARQLAEKRLAALTEERNTWELLSRLHTPMLFSHPDDESFANDPVNHAKTEQVAIDIAFRANEDELQLLSRVTEWLQMIAREECTYTRGAEQGAYKPRSTRVLRGQAVWPRQSSYVTKLDPDAPERDGNCLHPEDDDDEGKLLRGLWQLVRAGAFFHAYSHDLPEKEGSDDMTAHAVALCESFGEAWRAASLSGGKPVACESVEEEGQSFPNLRRSGNVNKSIWKAMCIKLSEQAKRNSNTTAGKYEGALYALLGCDAETVLDSPLCNRWVDQCWAKFRLSLQARLDNISLLHRQRCLTETPEVAGPKDDKYDNQYILRIDPLLNTRAGDIFLSLRESSNPVVRPQANDFFPTVQASLVTGGFAGLLWDMICPFLCGLEWRKHARSLVVVVCGNDFLKDTADQNDWIALGGNEHAQPDNDPINTDSSYEEDLLATSPPCWADETSSAVAPQYLRFVAHLSAYLNSVYANNDGVVVENEIEVPAHTACVMSYVVYLCSQKQFDVVLTLICDLPSTVQHAVIAGILEALSLASDSTKNSFVTLLSHNVVHGLSRNTTTETEQQQHEEEQEHEQEFIRVHGFLTLAVRNSRRRLLNSQPKPFFVSTSTQTCVELTRAEEHKRPRDANSEDWSALWEHVHTWRWLLCVPYTALQAVLQANVILRELARNHVQLVKDGDSLDGTTSACWGVAMLVLCEVSFLLVV